MAGRIFVAVELPDEARHALAAVLSGVDIPRRRVPPENWHLTLRFLGTIDEVAYERVLASLDQAPLETGFRVRFEGLGAFPNPRRATVLWMGVTEGAEQMKLLAVAVEEACVDAGFEPEDRPYRPHLTLARIRPHQDVRSLIATAAVPPVDIRVDGVAVYASHLGRGGARYELRHRFGENADPRGR